MSLLAASMHQEDWARVCSQRCARAGGLAPPLYIHSTTQGGIQGRLAEGSPETEWEQRVTQLFRSQARPPIPERHSQDLFSGNKLAVPKMTNG